MKVADDRRDVRVPPMVAGSITRSTNVVPVLFVPIISHQVVFWDLLHGDTKAALERQTPAVTPYRGYCGRNQRIFLVPSEFEPNESHDHS